MIIMQQKVTYCETLAMLTLSTAYDHHKPISPLSTIALNQGNLRLRDGLTMGAGY